MAKSLSESSSGGLFPFLAAFSACLQEPAKRYSGEGVIKVTEGVIPLRLTGNP